MATGAISEGCGVWVRDGAEGGGRSGGGDIGFVKEGRLLGGGLRMGV